MSDAPANEVCRSLWLIVALSVAPVAASYLLYYFWPPARSVELRRAARAAAAARSAARRWPTARRFSSRSSRASGCSPWWTPAGCDAYCEKKLLYMRQLRLTQGKDMERVERVWLISDDAAPRAAAVAAYQGTWLVRAGGSGLAELFPAARRGRRPHLRDRSARQSDDALSARSRSAAHDQGPEAAAQGIAHRMMQRSLAWFARRARLRRDRRRRLRAPGGRRARLPRLAGLLRAADRRARAAAREGERRAGLSRQDGRCRRARGRRCSTAISPARWGCSSCAHRGHRVAQARRIAPFAGAAACARRAGRRCRRRSACGR